MKACSFSTIIFLLICSLYSSIVSARPIGRHHHGSGHHRSHWGYGNRYYGRSGFGFYFGVPFSFYPHAYYPYNYSYYYPSPIINIPSSPPVYIQQDPVPDTTATTEYPPGYWYYCANPQGYYPSVPECPGGWIQVAPTPPPPPPPSSAQP